MRGSRVCVCSRARTFVFFGTEKSKISYKIKFYLNPVIILEMKHMDDR